MEKKCVDILIGLGAMNQASNPETPCLKRTEYKYNKYIINAFYMI